MFVKVLNFPFYEGSSIVLYKDKQVSYFLKILNSQDFPGPKYTFWSTIFATIFAQSTS